MVIRKTRGRLLGQLNAVMQRLRGMPTRTCMKFNIFLGENSVTLPQIHPPAKLEKALPKARSISLASPSFLPQEMPDTVFTTGQGADIACHGQGGKDPTGSTLNYVARSQLNIFNSGI